MFAEGPKPLRRAGMFVGACGGVLFLAMLFFVMTAKGTPSGGASPAPSAAAEKEASEKPKAAEGPTTTAEGPVAQVNGKLIIRLAGDDGCMNGRPHPLVCLIHDPTQTEFIRADLAVGGAHHGPCGVLADDRDSAAIVEDDLLAAGLDDAHLAVEQDFVVVGEAAFDQLVVGRLEVVSEDRNTLVFVPLNNSSARTTPNVRVRIKGVVKLLARPPAASKPK
jgi:hypothetical protein